MTATGPRIAHFDSVERDDETHDIAVFALALEPRGSVART